MVRRLCVIFSFSLAFFLVTPVSTQASPTSGTGSRLTTILIQTLARTVNYDYESDKDVASAKLGMSNWSVGKVTLAQAFGVDKGTVSFPKLKAQLPVTSAESTAAQNEPSGDSNPPTAKQEHANYEEAVKMAAAQPYNWTGAQMTAINNIVMAESGWNQKAENSSSGAYGIPQALPGSKMASAGPNWETNPTTQIAWMLEYIRSRYGTPEKAWAFHVAHGWY
jgi:hypothetical protein